MAIQTSAKTSYMFNAEGILVRDVSDQLHRVNPNASPFQTFMRALGAKKSSKSPKIEWYKDSLLPISTTANGEHNTTATTINVAAGTGVYFRAGTVFVVPVTGEQIRVTSVTTDALVVVRAYGSTYSDKTTGATIPASTPLLILSSAEVENGTVPALKMQDLVQDFNYAQIIKTPYGMSGSAIAYTGAGGTYGGDNFKNQKFNKAIEHLRTIELQLVFGERMDTAGTDARTCGGIRQFVTENKTAVGGTLSEAVMKAWMRAIFKQGRGSDTRILLCAPLIAEAISFWAQGKVQTVVDTKKYGMAIKYYFTDFGTLVVKPHWLFETGVYAGYAYGIDPSMCKYVYAPGRDTQEQLDVQAKGTDQRVNQFLTEFSFEMAAPEVHGALTGVTAYS